MKQIILSDSQKINKQPCLGSERVFDDVETQMQRNKASVLRFGRMRNTAFFDKKMDITLMQTAAISKKYTHSDTLERHG